MGRPEYNALTARTEADFSFVQQIDQLFIDSGGTSVGQVCYEATQDGLTGQTSIVLEAYNPDVAMADKMTIDVAYWRECGDADSSYSISVSSALQALSPNGETDPLVTDYEIHQYNGQYYGYVHHSLLDAGHESLDAGHEMTTYDYQELERILELAREVHLAEKRERAIIVE